MLVLVLQAATVNALKLGYTQSIFVVYIAVCSCVWTSIAILNRKYIFNIAINKLFHGINKFHYITLLSLLQYLCGSYFMFKTSITGVLGLTKQADFQTAAVK